MKGTRKSSEKKAERGEKGDNTIGPGLSIYGDVNDLDFYGDEEIFVNPVPSTSGICSKPVIPVEPVSNDNSNLLADIMACQKSFLTTSNRNSATAKMKEVYTKPEMKCDEKKVISTSVTRYKSQELYLYLTRTLNVWL